MRPLQRIRDIAEGQWSLLTLRQAKDAGVGWRSVSRLAEAGLLERVAHGIYRIRGAAEPDHLGLRAAWRQLDPGHAAWERLDDSEGAVVSHTSAAALHGVGDLRADVHEFTLPPRRQTRRSDLRLHRGRVPAEQRLLVHGLPTTRPARLIGDLLGDDIDPDSVAQITVEVLDRVLENPRVLAESLEPYASKFGLCERDGVALLDHLLSRAQYRNRAETVALARHE